MSQQGKQRNETTVDIKKAKLISDELNCDIRVIADDNETHGKAYLIDVLPLTDDKTNYTVLQRDVKGSWVAMETTLSSNEGIERQFRKQLKADTNHHYRQIPLYVTMVLMIFALVWFSWITLTRKLVLFESKDIWLLILGFVLFVVLNILLTYYINTQRLDVIDFHSLSFPRTETYTIHFEGLIQTITAQLYRGRFIDFKNNTNKYIFGYNASEIQGGLKDDDGVYFIDKVRQLATERNDLEDELANLYMNIADKERKITTLQYSQHSRLDIIDEETKESAKNEDTEVIDELKQQKDKLLTEFEEKEEKYGKRIEKIKSEIVRLENKYADKIEDIIGEQVDKRKKSEIINAEQTISKLKSKLANQKIDMIGMANNYSGVMSKYSKQSAQIDDRVDMELSSSKANQISIQTHRTGQMESNGITQNKQGITTDWTPLLMFGAKMLVIAIIAGMFMAKVSDIINALAQLQSWAGAAMIFGLIILIIIVIIVAGKAFNWGRRQTKDADKSYIVGN